MDHGAGGRVLVLESLLVGCPGAIGSLLNRRFGCRGGGVVVPGGL